MSRAARSLPLAILLAGALLGASPARAVTVPADFVVENAAGSATFVVPTALAFTPSGRVLVAEKHGRVWAITNGVKGAAPLLDLSAQVLDNGDRGLLGLAVDPQFPINRYVYLLYTVDPDSNGVDDDDDAFGRLARYQLSAVDSNVIDPASRTVLIGATWAGGIPSGSDTHTEGALRWGRDGSLLVSAGEGAQYNSLDFGGQDPNLFLPGHSDPYDDIGAYRAQSIGGLAGKLLRVNPANGHGYPSNPYFDGNPASNRSRVWAYGFRNPFRFCARPGTGSEDPGAASPGTLFIGDVGWATWEDLNISSAPGQNFGWPCFEGIGPNSPYQIGSVAHHGCGTLGTSENPAVHTPPALAFHHADETQSTPAGTTGNAIICGAFYTADRWPAAYWGGLLVADYAQNWIKVAHFDEANQLVAFDNFATGAQGPVDFATHPQSGDVFYVSITTGEVRRIRYTGSQPNRSPIALTVTTMPAGPQPLEVSFNAAGSTDPDLDPLDFSWDFGDGSGATGATLAHSFTRPGTFTVVVTVDDNRGGIDRDTVTVVAIAGSSHPTTAVLDDFNRSNGPLGAAWGGELSGLTISAQRVASSCCASVALWNAAFGADQEAFATLAVGDPGAAVDLVLKAQAGADPPRARVRYESAAAQVHVATFDPEQGWVERTSPIAATFAAGQRFGARAYSNGVIEVWRDSTRLASVFPGDWPYAAAGGRIGFGLVGASDARLDDVGGGNAVIDPNHAPLVIMSSPADSSFFYAGQSLALHSFAVDIEDSGPNLDYLWTIDLHHNNHVHPSVFNAGTPNASYVAQNHDDGTGVWLELRIAVTDLGGRTTTVTRHVFPEIDLRATDLSVKPEVPGTLEPAEYRFTLRNTGRLPSPRFRWRLFADATTLAQADTNVLALDSVRVTVRVPPLLAAGPHVLRVVADTLRAIPETDEANNAATRPLTVVNGHVADELPPLLTYGPIGSPAASHAWLRWKTDEPTTGVARYGTTLALGDSSADPLARDHAQQLNGLPLGTKIYFRIAARDTAANGILSALDSLITQGSATEVPASVAPARFALTSAFPNPSHGATSFTLELPEPARVEFAIFDIAGREVWRERPQWHEAGRWTLKWSGIGNDGVASRAGLYQARAQAGNQSVARRFVRVR